MIAKVKQILSRYAQVFNEKKEKFEKERSEILKMYSVEYAGEAISKLTLEHTESMAREKQAAENDLNAVFESARQSLCNCVTVSMSDDFVTEFAACKTVQLTNTEFNLLAKKHKNNYMAVKSLEGLAKNNNLKFLTYTIDDKLNELEKMRLLCLDCLRTYQGRNTSYKFENLVKGTIVDSTCESLKTFAKIVE